MLDSLIKSQHNRSSNASNRKASLKSLGHINPDAKGAWDFPNKEMSSAGARRNCLFRRVYGQRLCLLFSKISISADHNAPAFSEAGTLFCSPILKKRRENVRCIVERFLKTAKKSRTKPEKVSVCYMKGKISINPCFFLPNCPL